MKDLFMQGILSNQEGQDTLEWTAIAALIVLVAIAVIAIVGNYVKERATQITW
jgi:Flp pilus assembly pilin Flp